MNELGIIMSIIFLFALPSAGNYRRVTARSFFSPPLSSCHLHPANATCHRDAGCCDDNSCAPGSGLHGYQINRSKSKFVNWDDDRDAFMPGMETEQKCRIF